jgi:ligand-binding sensor domain-containing protein
MNLSVSNRRLPNIEGEGTTSSTLMALLMDDGKIYAYVFGHWYQATDEPPNPVTVVVGPGGFWCLDSTGHIHKWNEDVTDSEWKLDTVASKVTTLSCDAEGTLWCTNQQGDLYFSNVEPLTGDNEMPLQMGAWTKAAFEGAWFFGDIWDYTAKPGDHLLKIVRSQYKATDVDEVYHIADEIVRLSKITKKRDSVKAGQRLIMPPLGYR